MSLDELSQIRTEYRKLAPELLDEPELEYELRIRGVQGISGRSELRHAFRNFFGADFDPEETVVTGPMEPRVAEKELAAAAVALRELTAALEDDLTPATGRQLRARLAHWWARMERGRELTADPNFITYRNEAAELYYDVRQGEQVSSNGSDGDDMARRFDANLRMRDARTLLPPPTYAEAVPVTEKGAVGGVPISDTTTPVRTTYTGTTGTTQCAQSFRSLFSGAVGTTTTSQMFRPIPTPTMVNRLGATPKYPLPDYAPVTRGADSKTVRPTGTERSESQGRFPLTQSAGSFRRGGLLESDTNACGSVGHVGVDVPVRHDSTERPRQGVPLADARSTNDGQFDGEDLHRMPRVRGLPISKWRVDKYDGNPKQLARFLAKVAQLREAEGAVDRDLFVGRVHLFTGNALDFVLTSEVNTWTDLCDDLSTFVHGHRSDSARLRALENMKQSKTESCTAYMNTMELEFRSLRQRLSDRDKVDLVLKGLRSDVGVPLAGNVTIRSMADLRGAAARVESLLGQSKLISEVVEDEPSSEVAAYGQPGGRRPSRVPRTDRNQLNPPQGPATSAGLPESERQKRSPLLCNRCGQAGHVRVGCRNPEQPVCRRCGQGDHQVTTCPRAQSGN